METIRCETQGPQLIIHLERGRANAINQQMVQELRQAIRDAQTSDSIKGVILQGQPRFFSAGLDVVELYQYDTDQMQQFWHSFLDLVHELTRFDKPLIASITGHSPAGGCILAICCDYRVMINNPLYRIGLNEVPVGIIIPSGVMDLYGFWLGKGKAYQAMMAGQQFTAEEAVANGLVDTMVEEGKELAAAQQQLKHYLRLPQTVWRATKRNLRRELILASAISAEDRQQTLDFWWTAEARQQVGQLVNRLRPTKKA